MRSDSNSPLAPGQPTNGEGTRDHVSCLISSHRVYLSEGGLHSSRWLEVGVCLDRVGDTWGVVAWEVLTRPTVTCDAPLESP